MWLPSSIRGRQANEQEENTESTEILEREHKVKVRCSHTTRHIIVLFVPGAGTAPEFLIRKGIMTAICGKWIEIWICAEAS